MGHLNRTEHLCFPIMTMSAGIKTCKAGQQASGVAAASPDMAVTPSGQSGFKQQRLLLKSSKECKIAYTDTKNIMDMVTSYNDMGRLIANHCEL